MFTSTYQQVSEYQGKKVRTYLRDRVLDFFSLGNKMADRYSTIFTTPRVQFLYVHHIFRDEEDDFRKLLQFLSRDHVFITYSEGIRRVLENDIDKPYIVFSSDDGFKNNLAAASILKEYGASGCFFVCPAIIGENDFNKIQQFCSEKLRLPPVEFMNWSDISQLISEGHEIGGHTMSHADLGRISSSYYQYEIGQCESILSRQIGKVRHFAFPYGTRDNITNAARDYIYTVGFESIATAVRGCYFNNDLNSSNTPVMFFRDHLILKWRLDHIKYFLYQNIALHKKRQGNG